MDDRQGAGAAPSDADLERAIASVPGVASASVRRSEATGRSRLRIRLAAGEDPEKVSWAVAATLRERFSIVLDPEAIRPREDGEEDGPAGEDDDPTDAAADAVGAEDGATSTELAATRDRLSSAAREALAGLRERVEPGEDETPAATAGEAVETDEDPPPAGPRGSHVGRPWPVRPLEPSSRRRATQVETVPGTGAAGRAEPASSPAASTPAASSRASRDGGTDVATRQRPVAPPATPATAPPQITLPRARAERAAIRHLDTRRDERDVRITATLEHGGRSARGEVTTVPTTHGVMRAVAEATIAALGVLVGPGLVAGVDRVSVQPSDDPANALVAVSLITDRGEERLLGTSIVRGDPEHAVMRATLDALNRRVGELFSPSDPPPAGDSAA